MTREDILRALRDEFRANTRSRLTEMDRLLDQLRRSPDSETLRELERHFHGLAGLGGTYGYQSVTSLSREGESLAEDGFSVPVAADYDKLSEILRAIAAAIEEVPDSE